MSEVRNGAGSAREVGVVIKRAAPGLLVVMELFCILTVVVNTGTYICDKIA